MSVTEQLRSYGECVFSPGDWVETRCIQRTTRRIKRDWILAEHLADQADRLAALNAQGVDVYAGANRRIASGSTTDAGVDLCRTVFVDFDHLSDEPGASYDDIACARIAAAGLPLPTLRIFTGHGVHAYWRLASPIRPGEWSEVQNRLIVTLDSDPAIKNPERIMRLPGFANVKDPDHPVDCFILDADPSRIVDLADLLAHCRAAAQVVPVARVDEPGRTQERAAFTDPEKRAVAYAAKWPHCEEPGRNAAAYLHACQLVNDFSVPEDFALGLLRAWNAGNRPPLPDAEIISVMHSAQAYHRFTAGAKRDRGRQQVLPRPCRAGSSVEGAKTTQPGFNLRVVDLDRVIERETEWLHEGYVPLGALTIVGGNPGSGKTSLGMNYATCLSRGWAMPLAGAGSARTGTTIIIGEEDSASRVLRGRLRRMGADLGKIKVFEGLRIAGEDEPFTLDQGLGPLDALMDKYPDAKLLILDPITDFLGFDINPNSNQDVRRVLRPVNPWADRHNVAVLGITHLNKRKDDDAAFRLLGSMGFVAIARAVLGVAVHPEDADKPAWEKRRIVTPVKQSYSAEGDSLVFRLDRSDQTLLWDPCHLSMSATEALGGAASGKTASTTKAEAWLRGQLDNSQGPLTLSTLRARAEEERVCSERTLHRAAEKIGVARATIGFGPERVVWWGRPGMNLDLWVTNAAV